MDARDTIQAVRTVVNETYVQGAFTSASAAVYMQNGDTFYKTKVFYTGTISDNATGDYNIYETAAALMGKPYHPFGPGL
jgi:hypothetical protein